MHLADIGLKLVSSGVCCHSASASSFPGGVFSIIIFCFFVLHSSFAKQKIDIGGSQLVTYFLFFGMLLLVSCKALPFLGFTSWVVVT
jgi:hypothetical protein